MNLAGGRSVGCPGEEPGSFWCWVVSAVSIDRGERMSPLRSVSCITLVSLTLFSFMSCTQAFEEWNKTGWTHS